MLDKSLKYMDILMKREAAPAPEIRLPEGFRFVNYLPGDEKDWARIEAAVLEFDDEAQALKYFSDTFLPHQDELLRRCFFIEDAQTGEKAATAMSWWELIDGNRTPWLHWIGVMPGYQGKGLGVAMVGHCIAQALEIEGPVDLHLHTQTWSHRAVNIYLKYGFRVVREPLGEWKNDKVDEALAIIAPFMR